MKKLFLISTAVLGLTIMLLTTCREDKSWFKNTTTHGVVIDTLTKNPIANATVTLIREEETSNSGWLTRGPLLTPITSRQTSSDGSFSIKFHYRKKDKYRLEATKSGYYSSYEVIYYNNNSLGDGQLVYVTGNDFKTIYIVKK